MVSELLIAIEDFFKENNIPHRPEEIISQELKYGTYYLYLDYTQREPFKYHLYKKRNNILCLSKYTFINFYKNLVQPLNNSTYNYIGNIKHYLYNIHIYNESLKLCNTISDLSSKCGNNPCTYAGGEPICYYSDKPPGQSCIPLTAGGKCNDKQTPLCQCSPTPKPKPPSTDLPLCTSKGIIDKVGDDPKFYDLINKQCSPVNDRVCVSESNTYQIISSTETCAEESYGSPFCLCDLNKPNLPTKICSKSIDNKDVSGIYIVDKSSLNKFGSEEGGDPNAIFKVCYLEGSNNNAIYSNYQRLPNKSNYILTDISTKLTNFVFSPYITPNYRCVANALNTFANDINNCMNESTGSPIFCRGASADNHVFTFTIPEKSTINPCTLADICNIVCHPSGPESEDLNNQMSKLCNKYKNADSCTKSHDISNIIYSQNNGQKTLIENGILYCKYENASEDSNYAVSKCVVDTSRCPNIINSQDDIPLFYPCYEASGTGPDCVVNDFTKTLDKSLHQIFYELEEEYKSNIISGLIGIHWPKLLSSDKSILQVHSPLNPQGQVNLLTDKPENISNSWWLSSGLQLYTQSITPCTSEGEPITYKTFGSLFTYLDTILRPLFAYNYDSSLAIIFDLSGKISDDNSNPLLKYIPSNIKNNTVLMQKYLLQILTSTFKNPPYNVNYPFLGQAVDSKSWNFNTNNKNILIQANLQMWMNSFNQQPSSYIDSPVYTGGSTYIPNSGNKKIDNDIIITLSKSEPINPWERLETSFYNKYSDISNLYMTNDPNEKLIVYKNNIWAIDISSYNTFEKFLLEETFNNFEKGVVYFNNNKAYLDIVNESYMNNIIDEVNKAIDTLQAIQNSTKYGLYSNSSVFRPYCEQRLNPCSSKLNIGNSCIVPSPKTDTKSTKDKNVFFNCRDRDYNSLTYKIPTYLQYVKQVLSNAKNAGNSINDINQQLLTSSQSWFSVVYPIWYWNDISDISWGSARKNEGHIVLDSLSSEPLNIKIGGMPQGIAPPPPLILVKKQSAGYELSLNKYYYDSNDNLKTYKPYETTIREQILQKPDFSYLLPHDNDDHYSINFMDYSNKRVDISWNKTSPFNDLFHYWISVLVPACQGVIDWSFAMNTVLRPDLEKNALLTGKYTLLNIDPSLMYQDYSNNIYQCKTDKAEFVSKYKQIDNSNTWDNTKDSWSLARYSTFMKLLFDGSFSPSSTWFSQNNNDLNEAVWNDSTIKSQLPTPYSKWKGGSDPDDYVVIPNSIMNKNTFMDISRGWNDWYNNYKTFIPPNYLIDPSSKTRIEYDYTDEYLHKFNQVSEIYYNDVYKNDALAVDFSNYFAKLSPPSNGLKFGTLTTDGSYILPPTLYQMGALGDYGILENYRLAILNKIDEKITDATDISGHIGGNDSSNHWSDYLMHIQNSLLSSTYDYTLEVPSNIPVIKNSNFYLNLYQNICDISTVLTKNFRLELLKNISQGGGEGILNTKTHSLKIYSNIFPISELITYTISSDLSNSKAQISKLIGLNVLSSTYFDDTHLNTNSVIDSITTFYEDYINQNYANTLQDLQILFYQQIVPLLNFKYGSVLTNIYILALKNAMEKFSKYISDLRMGIKSSPQLLFNKQYTIFDKQYTSYRNTQDMFSYNSSISELSDISYITKYIFDFSNGTDITILDGTIKKNIPVNNIYNLNNLYTVYANAFNSQIYTEYSKYKDQINQLQINYNNYIFKYALLVDTSINHYDEMINYYKYAPSMELIINIINSVDISLNTYFDDYLFDSSFVTQHNSSYEQLYNNIINDISRANNNIKYYASTISGITEKVTNASHMFNNLYSNIITNCDLGKSCIPTNPASREGIWYDMGKYSPKKDNSWNTISKFLLKNGVHNFNFAFSQLKTVMLCVYADVIHNHFSTSIDLNNDFKILVTNLNDPLNSNDNNKDTVYPFFDPSKQAANYLNDPLTRYTTAYSNYKKGFASLKSILNNYDPSAILGLSFGGENAEELDNFILDETIINTMVSESNPIYNIIQLIVESYKTLIYGDDIDGGCDTCDYDLENAGLTSTSNYGKLKGQSSVLKWYQFIFFSILKNKLTLSSKHKTQKLTLLGDPTKIPSIYNLISNGAYCFDAINIMGYGDGTTWYISADPTTYGNLPVSFNTQAWLNVMCTEWIDQSFNIINNNIQTITGNLDTYTNKLSSIHQSITAEQTLEARFYDIHMHEQKMANINTFLNNPLNDMKIINTDPKTPGLLDKLIMCYQDNTNYYDPNKNNNDIKWSQSVNARVLDIFGHDITKGSKATVGREAWYINLMWWVDTLSWVNNGLTHKISESVLLNKLMNASKGVHFWLDENKNQDPNITNMNPNSLNLFATYSILNRYLFTDNDTFNQINPNMLDWIDSSDHKTLQIRKDILHQINSGHAGSNAVCTNWLCKEFMWGIDPNNITNNHWLSRNININSIDDLYAKINKKPNIMGGWSNTNQEGTWDISLGNNTICLGPFGAQNSVNFGAGPPLIPSKFGSDTSVNIKINKYSNKWYTIGGEDQNTVTFGDQAFTRMSIDIGGYWTEASSATSFSKPEWKKLSGYSSSWSSDQDLPSLYNKNIIMKEASWNSSNNPIQTYINDNSLNWIMKILDKDISFNGICFDTEATGLGPPWRQKGDYSDPFIRAIKGQKDATWKSLNMQDSGMGTFQVYVARRWMNMYRDKLEEKFGSFTFSCAPETNDSLSDKNLYLDKNIQVINSFLLFNKDEATSSSTILEVNNLKNVLHDISSNNKPFDYLIPQMYNNNLAYKKWDPFIYNKDTVIFGDCKYNNGKDPPFATCLPNNKFQWNINNTSPSDTIKDICHRDKGNWSPKNVILTYESAAAYMYTFDPSLQIDFSMGSNSQYINIIQNISGVMGISGGWERDCIGTSNTTNWTQSFQDSSGLFWKKLTMLTTGRGNFKELNTLQNDWGLTTLDSNNHFAGVLGWPAQEEKGQKFPAVDGINTIKLLNSIDLTVPTPAPTPQPTPQPPTPAPTPSVQKYRCDTVSLKCVQSSATSALPKAECESICHH